MGVPDLIDGDHEGSLSLSAFRALGHAVGGMDLPASFGRDGELTVDDVDVSLGHLSEPDR